MIAEHQAAPHLRVLQKALAKDITIRIHSETDYLSAVEASEILFGKGTAEALHRLDEETLISVFEGVPQYEISTADLSAGIGIVDLVADKTTIFPSKGEARRMLKDGGVQVNKTKVGEEFTADASQLLSGKYLLVQKGKKNYYLLIVK
jgi:tyrosyl-tRNA synthetase